MNPEAADAKPAGDTKTLVSPGTATAANTEQEKPKNDKKEA